MYNSLQIVAAKATSSSIQKGISVLTKRIDEVDKSMAAITTSLKQIPSKRELQLYTRTMEDQMAQVAEVNTELTTSMEGYKFSES